MGQALGGAALAFLSDYLTVARAEYLKGELPAVFIPALLCATTFGRLLALEVVLSIAVFALLYVTGFFINAVTDREVDLKYGSFKRSIGAASQRLGNRTILALIAIHLAAGFALTGLLAMRLGNPWLIPLAAFGVFLALAYSAPPFAFKTRGVAWHALSLSLSAFTVPFLFLYIAARGALDAEGLLVVGAFSAVGYSLEYANQAYDFTEDLEAGLATPVVRLGLVRSLRLAVWTFFLALPLLAFTLAHLAVTRAAVAFAVGPAGLLLVALAAAGAVAAGYAVAIRGMVRIYRASQEKALGAGEMVERVRRECNYALWQSSGVGGLFAFALVVFALTSTAVSHAGEAAPNAFSLGGPVTMSGGPVGASPDIVVSGDVTAAAGASPFMKGELWLERDGPNAWAPVARVPIVLPAAGATTSFRFHAADPAALGGGATFRLQLMVDTDFDGKVDAVAASTVPVRA